jgi:hypothetical protein
VQRSKRQHRPQVAKRTNHTKDHFKDVVTRARHNRLPLCKSPRHLGSTTAKDLFPTDLELKLPNSSLPISPL